jgi:uncharacterized membrane protein YagU involved in acid resistance
VLAVTVQLATLAWVVAIVVDSSPFSPASAFLIGLGLLAMSTVSFVGMVVSGGRWAHRLALVTLAFSTTLALARPVDFVWVAGVVLTAIALVALLSPTLTGSIRQLPSASGPPPRAITPPLILLATPCVLGFLGNASTEWALLVVGVSAPTVAFLYSRVLPGGLIAIRLVWPAIALALSPLLGWAAGVAASTIAVAVAVIAWDDSVKASYHPPREVGTTFPIPPELAPKEVLDAADIDETGRRASPHGDAS